MYKAYFGLVHAIYWCVILSSNYGKHLPTLPEIKQFCSFDDDIS